MFKHILIIRFSSIGDLILLTGPLAKLRKQFPGLEVDLLTSEMGQELFINSLNVDDIYVVDKGASLGYLVSKYRKLPQYDIVIDLQGNFKSYFLKFFQGAEFYRIEKQSKERRAFVKKRKYKDKLTQHVTEKYYATLKKAFKGLPELSGESLRPLFPTQDIVFDSQTFDFSKAVAIHPFASQKNKEWPHFPKLVEKLISKNTPVVVVGHGSEDIELPDSPLLLNLVNKTTLREMALILHTCCAVVTTDSGPMHMGIAVNTPVLALFGPTTKEFGFYPHFENCEVIEKDLECRPCHVHGGDTCPLKHHDCMEKILVEDVEKKLSQWL